jgi:hypothetical protein
MSEAGMKGGRDAFVRLKSDGASLEGKETGSSRRRGGNAVWDDTPAGGEHVGRGGVVRLG